MEKFDFWVAGVEKGPALSKQRLKDWLVLVGEMEYIVSQCRWFFDAFKDEMNYEHLDREQTTKWLDQTSSSLAVTKKLLLTRETKE